MKNRYVSMCFVWLALLVFSAGCSDDESTTEPQDNPVVPRVSSILPPGASSGIEVTISGTKFGDSQGSGGVQVAGEDADIVSWSDNQVVFTMPAGLSEGLGASVALTTSAGSSLSTQINITPPNTYQVTTDESMDQQPCWNSAGDWIYFSSTRVAGDWNIWRIPAKGGIAEQVTSDPSLDLLPDINPSSGELAWSSQSTFSGQNPEGEMEIFRGFVLCPGPGTACTMSMMTDNDSRDLTPSWANTVYSGYYMTYTYEQVDQSGHFVAWWVMLVATGDPVELTQGLAPSFSPDGQWVTYSHDVITPNIYKIPTGGGSSVQLTSYGQDSDPDWGGNDQIVFQRFDVDTGGAEDIYIMNSDGSNVQPLVSTRSSEYYPSWSNDGTKVVYYANVGGSINIYVYVMP